MNIQKVLKSRGLRQGRTRKTWRLAPTMQPIQRLDGVGGAAQNCLLAVEALLQPPAAMPRPGWRRP
eukprot:6140069-Pyramimonas_sp.AAC.1